MKYAYIEEGVVTNIIWLNPQNESEFPSAVRSDNLAICIGDTYEDGAFYRNGELILTTEDLLIKQNSEKDIAIAEKNALIAELDTAILDMTYNSLLEE